MSINSKEPTIQHVDAAASANIGSGDMVMEKSDGYGDVPSSTANNRGIAGIATKAVDNSSGADGDLSIPVQTGVVVQMKAASVSQADIGTVMFAVDKETVDETDTGDLPAAGIMVDFESSTKCWVYIDRALNKVLGIGNEDQLTDSSGGTTDGTVEAVSGSGADAAINNNFSELTTKVNNIIAKLGG